MVEETINVRDEPHAPVKFMAEKLRTFITQTILSCTIQNYFLKIMNHGIKASFLNWFLERDDQYREMFKKGKSLYYVHLYLIVTEEGSTGIYWSFKIILFFWKV